MFFDAAVVMQPIVDKNSVEINIHFLATSVAKLKRKSRTNRVRCEFHCSLLPLASLQKKKIGIYLICTG